MNGGYKMLSYNKYGFGKVGYLSYQFKISDDYSTEIRIAISKEVQREERVLGKVALNEEEKSLVDTFIENNIKRRTDKSFIDEKEDFLEGNELRYNGEIIQNDELIKKFNLIKEYIMLNHQELSSDIVVETYNEATNRIYHSK
jgi:hypothetical protein